jgi:hypothetical protein
MANKKLMTSVAFTAALLAGGVAGAVLGVPGVSGAQTTTVPNAPNTTVPGGSQANPDRPPHDGTCPNMGGAGSGGSGPGSPGGTAPSQGTGASQTRFHYGGRF